MAWQRHVLEVALEVDDAGKLVYRNVVVIVPRQCGKSTLLFVLRTFRSTRPDLFGGPQVTVFTAQDRGEALRKWVDVQLPVLQSSSLAPDIAQIRRSNGKEGLSWVNGSREVISATTAVSAHGETVDLAILDEAWAQTDSRMEQAFAPAMITRPCPQSWVVSTAGDHRSIYLRDKLDAGRKAVDNGVETGLCFFEWSAPDDADIGDPAVWAEAIPALGETIGVDAIAANWQTMSGPEFARAHLCVWPTSHVLDPPIFGRELIESLIVEET